VKIEQLARAAPTVQEEAVSIAPAVEADPVIWTARPRTGRVVTLRASVSRAFRAAASIASVAGEDPEALAVIASVVAEDLAAAATDSVVVAGALAALAAAAVAGSGAGAEN
jgi:hypothetical protein